MINFTRVAWEQYVYWQQTDKKVLRKINGLIKECMRTPFAGTGKPEPLKGELSEQMALKVSQDERG